MKKLSLRFLSLFLLIWWASAIEFRSGQSVVIDSVLDETLAASASDINVTAPVDGDAFLAGNTITLWADITEDVWMAGNVLTTSANIQDDLRAAWQILNIWGSVDGDVMLWWNTATLNASVWWDLYVWGNLVTINGAVTGDANIWAGVVTINNTIGWDMTFEWDTLNFWSWWSIAGNLWIAPGAQIPANLSGFVWGTITDIEWFEKEFNFGDDHEGHDDHDHDKWFHFNFFRFITMAILWSLAIRFMPNYTSKASSTIVANPGKTFLYGLLILICTPFVALILIATWIWAPIWWWLLANYLFLWIFLGLFVVVFAADYLVDKRLHEYIGNTIRAKIGVVIVLSFILTLLPYAITAILWLFGVWAGWLNDMKIFKNNA